MPMLRELERPSLFNGNNDSVIHIGLALAGLQSKPALILMWRKSWLQCLHGLKLSMTDREGSKPNAGSKSKFF
jgi:hypothetical protein